MEGANMKKKLIVVLALAATLASIGNAPAQTYPSRPLRWVVPFPPGGPADVIARLMGQLLSDRLGQPVIFDNRPGAGGNVGTEAVVKAVPDGYTVLQISAPNAINATLYERLNFDFIRDIVPVASFMRVPGVMVVNPLVPAKTVPEFIAYAKSNRGKLNMASGGIGTPQQVYGELFKMMAGVDMLHVPYRGGAAALTDLLSGEMQVMFEPIPTAVEYIKAGKLRPLAVTTATRLGILPDIPTMAEFLPGYEASGWQGIGAPKNTPSGIVAMLNRETDVALTDLKIRERIANLGGTVLAISPAEFARLIADDTEKWAKVIKFAGIKPE